MFRGKSILCCVIALTVSMSYQSITYANGGGQELTDMANEFVSYNKTDIENDGLHIVNENGALYNKNRYEENIKGWSYDNLGNLYYSNEDGVLLKDARNEDGLYFNEDGRLHNKYSDNLTGYLDMARRFERGDKVKFKRQEDLLDFFEYYSLNYKLLDYKCEYIVHQDNEGKYWASLDKNKIYSRDELRHKILDMFGTIDKDLSDYDKLLEVSKRIADNMEYDRSYIDLDLNKALTDKKGVCWHFTKIAKVLLEEAEVQTEVMIGFMDNESHMWVRCLVDGKWLYSDPTLAKSMWWNYSNIAYSIIRESYRPIRNVRFVQ